MTWWELVKSGGKCQGIHKQRRAEMLKRKAEMLKTEMMKVEGVDGLGIPLDK